MLRFILSAFIFSLASIATAASTAASSFTAIYSLARNGIELGQVTDNFHVTGDHYSLISESRATGILKLVLSGTIHLESHGTIANNALAPSLYRRIRSDDPKKSEKVEFDWKAKALTLTRNGQAKQEPLPAGTQDNLSQAYSFLFLPSLPEKVVVPIASAKNVVVYRYNQYPSPAITTAAGKFDVVEYRRDAVEGEKSVSVWISRDFPHLPVQVKVVDKGVRVEQKLTRIKPGG
ncbi:MAG: DUF3108 domain-containing protein [Thiobacillaceae bacterium]